MKKLRQIWKSTLLLLFSLVAQAEDTTLTGKINALLNDADKNITASIKRHVVLLTPADKLASLCAAPQLSLHGNPRLSGNRTVVAQCGTKKHFLQVRIEAEGSWWVAARELKTGSVLSPDDMVQRRGSLANLPAGVVMDLNDFRGAVLTRPLRTGQPLTQNQLRKKWRINRGEEIDIIAHGNGFHIRSKGKALGNAAINEAIRVRMKSGQLVTGSVHSDGSVRINL